MVPLNVGQLDWTILDRLRDNFLWIRPGSSVYWHTRAHLEQYDLTYGERIGWKWDSVLGELARRKWNWPQGAVLDWGCGSGIAGRRWFRHGGDITKSRLYLADRSAAAVVFSSERARQELPGIVCETNEAAMQWRGSLRERILLVSHVLNELDDRGIRELRSLIDLAAVVVWIEPGTREVSRSLVAWREELRSDWQILGPCTHNGRCGLMSPTNVQHWCHEFAQVPPFVFTDSGWVQFGHRAGIDLRSLPYSSLVIQRKERPKSGVAIEGAVRIVGTPRVHKGYAKIFGCTADGVSELMLQKRDLPEVFKRLEEGEVRGLGRWKLDLKRVKEWETIAPQDV